MTSLREMIESGETVEVTENTSEVEGTVEGNVEASADLILNTEDQSDETEEVTPPTPPTPPARLDFADRAEGMGLAPIGNGCFHYSDEFCEIAYRNLMTNDGAQIMDNYQVPQVAIFTKGLDADSEWKYIGLISNSYKFVGNGNLIGSIRTSLQELGSPIFNEDTIFSPNFSQIRHEMVIQNQTNVPNVGDVYPQVIITNSYDGTKASHITFGLFFNDGTDDIRFGSTKKLGNIRQIHMEGSATTMGAAIGEYVNVFTSNIGDLVTENFNNHLTETDMMKALDMVEKSVGKKRREALSEILTTDRETEGVESWSMTSWQLFNAIAKFSTLEKNLNAKTLIENAAERVLVIPVQMADALSVING